jgi:uncharacterized membrane protein YeaQ/YmgE (transglycosylase-associated protein family)
VLSKARGYIKKYDITNKKEDTSTVEVTVKAEVGKDELSKDVDAALTLIHQKGKPKVLIMVAEQNVGQPTAQAWWANQGFTTNLDVVENTFIDQWQPVGFSFVDPQALAGKIKVSKAMQSAAMEDKDVKEFGMKMGAQVVIYGKAVAQEVGSKVMGTDARQGGLANIVVGIIGAVIGGLIASSVFGDARSNNGMIASFFVALLGSCLVIFVWKRLSGPLRNPRNDRLRLLLQGQVSLLSLPRALLICRASHLLKRRVLVGWGPHPPSSPGGFDTFK